MTHATIIKVFNDFKNWKYRMPKLSESRVSLTNSSIEVVLPHWAKDEVS